MATATRHDASAADTETRLLDAAERLFAERGVGAVSLRAVMQEAGTNVAAIHYHFGSKEALLEAVVRRRTADVSTSRDLLLEGPGEDTARSLAAAFIHPLLTLVESGGRDWVRMVAHLLSANDPALGPISTTFFDRNAAFVARVARLDPTAGPRTVAFRLAQAMSLTLRVLGDLERTQVLMAGDGEPWTPQEVTEQLLDLVASVLAGPPA
ncbi:TetR/AcrR family transcriptional regulator [Marmoricola sp. RAF53]|uniref:TetR/AcrR family transcriptional regulator n=1 Tax=Marmoricola sp. RAF53 TaxID=3233059 RepID=UPI003F9C3DB9